MVLADSVTASKPEANSASIGIPSVVNAVAHSALDLMFGQMTVYMRCRWQCRSSGCEFCNPTHPYPTQPYPYFTNLVLCAGCVTPMGPCSCWIKPNATSTSLLPPPHPATPQSKVTQIQSESFSPACTAAVVQHSTAQHSTACMAECQSSMLV